MADRDSARLTDRGATAERDEPRMLQFVARRIAPLFDDETDLKAELDEMVRLGLLTVVDGDRYQTTDKADALLAAAPQGEPELVMTLVRDPVCGGWLILADGVVTDEH